VHDDLVLLPLAVRWLLSKLPAALRADIDRRFGDPSSGTAQGSRRV
jgi:hypothetical protein